MKRITMTPGTVAPPEHRTDGACSCSLCTQLERAMTNPDPDPGRGFRALWASEMANARKAIERDDEILASGKYRDGPAGEVLGLSDLGWPPPALSDADRSASMDELVRATEEVGGYDAERAATERLADLAPEEVQPYGRGCGGALCTGCDRHAPSSIGLGEARFSCGHVAAGTSLGTELLREAEAPCSRCRR